MSASRQVTLAVIGAVSLAVAACSSPNARQSSSSSAATAATTAATASTTAKNDLGKIKHVVVIMQENRSFDTYFGTYPGADGIPAANGQFTVCIPDPATKGCQAPYHNPSDVNGGAGHNSQSAIDAIDGGKMDGFVTVAEKSAKGCSSAQDPACTSGTAPDVMGYHDAREIPNYWAYAQNFTLADRMFEPVASWSLPDHLYMVSAWSALCSSSDPASCKNNIVGPYTPAQQQRFVDKAIATGVAPVQDAWTDITYLLYKNNVSWGYYVEDGSEPDCIDAAATCPSRPQSYKTPGIWNPLPLFTDVAQDGQLKNVQPVQKFMSAAQDGSLPFSTKYPQLTPCL
jgi:phospholipase C